MTPVDPDRLASAVARLDPGSRALIELSLRREMPDYELSEVLGISEEDLRKRREETIRRVAVQLGRDDVEGLAEVRARLSDLPPTATRMPGRPPPEEGEPAHVRSGPAAFLRENSLSIFFGAIFLAALLGQAIAGHSFYNQEELQHGGEPLSFGRYLTSSDFGQAVMENWQSEYLQFTLFVLMTVWLVQRGSPESKELHKAGSESDEDQQIGSHATSESPLWARLGGIRTTIYSNSLLIVMGLIFLGSWFAHSVTGWSDYNANQLEHDDTTVSWLGYLGSSDFWQTTFQNWQSEFLAVGSMAVLAIYLRQRGSPESRPVGAPHEATGVEG